MGLHRSYGILLKLPFKNEIGGLDYPEKVFTMSPVYTTFYFGHSSSVVVNSCFERAHGGAV